MVRQRYIDILRGLAIFTVVYSHILIFCMIDYPESFIIELLRLFYLNGFFFISGYLFYKPIGTFSNDKLKEILQKKTSLILVPTLTMGFLYYHTHGIEMFNAIFDTTKMGYWFTFVLYEMFIMVAFLMWVFNNFRSRKYIELAVLLILMAGAFFIFRFSYTESNLMGLISAYNFLYYLPMFILGMLCRKYNESFYAILNIKLALTILFFIVMLSFFVTIPSFITSIAIVFMAFGLGLQIDAISDGIFYRSWIGRCLLLLGNYSMEIYFIHYFLLFEMPISISEYFFNISGSYYSLSFPEFIVVGSVAVGISLTCVAMARFLRIVPYMGKLLLGK